MHTASAIEIMAKATPALSALPGQLASAGFTADGIATRLDEQDVRAVLSNLAWHSLIHAHTAGPANDAQDVLMRLFVLNIPVPAKEFFTYVPAELRETLTVLDFVHVDGETIEGTVSLAPLSGRLVVADQLFRNRIPLGGELEFSADPVMPPHASTFLLLDNLGAPGTRVVDLGCGSGAVGLLAAGADQPILGIDIDERAIAYARLNAAINGAAAEYRVGDARSPARAEARADRLLFNSPSGPALADLGQMTAEEAIRATVTSAGELLVTGGRAALFTVLEVTAYREATRGQVVEWLGPHAAQPRIRFLESPHYGVSATEIRTRTIDGRSALVRDQRAKDALWRYLSERKVVEIVPAVVEFSLT